MNRSFGTLFTTMCIVLVCLGYAGCTSSYPVTTTPTNGRLSLAEFNIIAGTDPAQIVFQDNSSLDVKEVRADADSLSWIEPRTPVRNAASLRIVRKVTFHHRGGAGEGAGLGALAGLGIGFVVAAVMRGGDHSEFADLIWVVVPPAGAVAGVVLGVVVGAVVGHTDVYKFQPEPGK